MHISKLQIKEKRDLIFSFISKEHIQKQEIAFLLLYDRHNIRAVLSE